MYVGCIIIPSTTPQRPLRPSVRSPAGADTNFCWYGTTMLGTLRKNLHFLQLPYKG